MMPQEVHRKGRETAVMVTLCSIAIAVVVIISLSALTSAKAWVALLGFWGLTVLLSGTGLGLVYLGARRIAGAPLTNPSVSRDLAVVVALAIATVVAPRAMESLVGAGAGVVRGIVLETPFVVNLTEQLEAEQFAAGDKTCVPASTATASKGRACPLKVPQGSTAAMAAINDVVACVSDPAFCIAHDPKWVVFQADPRLIRSWITFAVTFLVALVISRSVIASRRDFLDGIQRRAAAKAGASAPAEHQKRALMEYPTWVAVGVYAAILLPATYLSVGSLVYLRASDGQAADLAAWTQDLDRVEHANVDAAPAFNPDAFTRAIGTLDPAVRDQLAADAAVAQANEVTFGRWRAQYLADALTGAKWETQHEPATTLASDKALLLAHYGHALRDARAALKPCLDQLSAVQRSADNPAKLQASQPEPAKVAGGQSAPTKSQPSENRLNRTADACKPVKLEVSPSSIIGENADGTPDQDGAQVLYGWLANSSDASILIVGLVGFGLFGSTIRMMGRVDVSPISAEQLSGAEVDAHTAASDVAVASGTAAAAREAHAHAVTALKQATDKLNAANDASADLQAKIAKAAALAAAEGASAADVAAANKELQALKAGVEPQNEAIAAAQQEVEKAKKAATDTEEASTAAQAVVAAKQRQAQEAQAQYDRLRTQSVNDRNSIVVRRVRANGEVETVISGAPGKVFLQGLGAAFTSFLMAQASTKVLSDGGRVSAWSILLACFLGAVFAEEIWAKAQQSLRGGPVKASSSGDGKAAAPGP